MIKPTTCLAAFTFLFLLVGLSAAFADDFQDGMDAFERKDYKTAYRLFLSLAKEGDADAQYKMGWFYEENFGLPDDLRDVDRRKIRKKATFWWRLSAEQGNANAQYELGKIFEHGRGVTQHYREAAKWYRLSAEQGNAKAQKELGWMYMQGRGAPKNNVTAHMWFNLSASQGNYEASSALYKVQKKMAAHQIEKAQEMARNWRPTTK